MGRLKEGRDSAKTVAIRAPSVQKDDVPVRPAPEDFIDERGTAMLEALGLRFHVEMGQSTMRTWRPARVSSRSASATTCSGVWRVRQCTSPNRQAASMQAPHGRSPE